MKKKLVCILLVTSMMMSMLSGCGASGSEDSKENKTTAEESAENKEDTGASCKPEGEIKVENATKEQVEAFMSDSDDKTVLVDARPQEAYSGWALEGAENGGHLKNAVSFSARWLDCEYVEAAPRTVYLERAMKDQGITEESEVIVYDYNGEQAKYVAGYFQNQGIENVTVFQANELIDNGKELEVYKNHDMFIPTEIVKSISDVKTGKAEELSAEAKEIVGNDLSKVVLVDVGWGNAKASTYFSVGHVPGAVHINTDSYERPRVYIPEKRAEYAKEYRLLPLDEFRDTVCPQYGITKDSIVILTGAGMIYPQGRLGLMLRSLGVKVYAMSGLLTAWKYNGYELDTDLSTLVVPESVESFGSNEIANPDEILWMDDIKAIMSGEMEGQLVDNRREEEYRGEESGYDYHDIAGRLDGAISCNLEPGAEGDYLTNVDYTARTKAELVAHYEAHGIDVSKTMAFYCGDSWGSAMIAYMSQSVDIETAKQWGNGFIPWSNGGNEFIDHNGNRVHYDKYRDAIVDKDGNDVSDGINILADKEEK